MSGARISINLNHPSTTFFPGQTITGRVVVHNDKSRDIKHISLICDGGAQVHWSESRSRTVGSGNNRRTENYTVHFRSSETYFQYKIHLLDNPSGSLILAPGEFSYPFQYTLPLNIPSSYNSSTGSVHYSIAARVKRSWYKPDIKSVLPFTVNGLLDLNMRYDLNTPQQSQDFKTTCCLWCTDGPLGYRLTIPKTGFVPGEEITYDAVFYNNSKEMKIKGVTAKLEQSVEFRAEGKVKHLTMEICRAHMNGVDPGEERTWEGGYIRIPAVPPTDLAGCRIIGVQYFLKLIIELDAMFSSNLKAKIPLVIGTIPFRTTFQNFVQRPQPQPFAPGPMEGHVGVPVDPTAISMHMPSAPVFDAYPDLPLPTYTEAMSGQAGRFEHHEEGGGNEDDPPPPYEFVPNYITYGWSGGK